MTAEMIVSVASASVPTLAVLVGILLSKNDVNRLDGRITNLETSLRGEMLAMRSEINGVRSELHTGIIALMGVNQDHEIRIARLEDKG